MKLAITSEIDRRGTRGFGGGGGGRGVGTEMGGTTNGGRGAICGGAISGPESGCTGSNTTSGFT
ncbi:MAG TPA: hypothetical protein VIM11_23925, partial [Tepidisphaeraceae bacterium]